MDPCIEASEEGPSDFRLLTRIARVLKQPVSEYMSEDPSFGLEAFFAFCPNPICDGNSVRKNNGKLVLFWNSWQDYPAQQFNDINFCPLCGEGLIKDCNQCHRRFPQKESRFCIRCGEQICKRPTDEEWDKLKNRFAQPMNPPPPPPTDEEIPF